LWNIFYKNHTGRILLIFK